MLVTREKLLKDLLQSHEGIHLTAYVPHSGRTEDVKLHIKSCIDQAYDFLNPVLSEEDRHKFLEPLMNLWIDDRLMSRLNGNIGLFRTRSAFRILSLPVPVDPQCIVATSFHVKPLLRWMQEDRLFLLLGLTPEAAHLYLGSQHSFTWVGSRPLPKFDRIASLRRVDEWVSQLSHEARFRLFIVGDSDHTRDYCKVSNYPRLVREPVAENFEHSQVSQALQIIRELHLQETSSVWEKAFFEFRLAEEEGRTRRNIFQIAKAAVEGRVRKLIVAEGVEIFGKLDHQTGGLAIHPCDLDHEDDDLLDDLAQTVLQQGGEVVIADREQIPKGRPILAILDSDGK